MFMMKLLSGPHHRKWENIQSIVGVVFEPVHDVAFAPNLGRLLMLLMVICSTQILIYLCLLLVCIVIENRAEQQD